MRVQFRPGAARQRWAAICRTANDAMPLKIVSRKLPDGTQQEYQRQQKAISDGAQQTGYALIMYYARNYRQLTLDMMEVQDDLTSNEPPSLRTNGQLLSEFRENICSRTSRTHIKALIDLGLITKKVFHGSKSSYELFFNLEILFGKDAVICTETPVFEPADSTNQGLQFAPENTSSSSENGIKFPHKQSLETNRNITTTISKVENSTELKHLKEPSTELKPLSKSNNGNTTSATHQNASNSNGNVAAAAPKIYSFWSKNVDNPAKNVDNYVDKWKTNTLAGKDFERQSRFVQNAIISLWKYARKELYFDRQFSEEEYLKTADLMLDGIYRPFLKEKPNERQFEEFQRELLASIDVAAKYFNNHTDKYPGQPYSTSENYLGYFDAKNARGFKIAVNWRFQNKAKQHEEYGKKVLNLAITHLQRMAIGDIQKLPKPFRTKTFTELYSHYKAKMLHFNTDTQQLFIKRFNQITFSR